MYKMIASYLATLFSGFMIGVYVYYLIDIPLFVDTPSLLNILGVGFVVLLISFASIFIAVRTYKEYMRS